MSKHIPSRRPGIPGLRRGVIATALAALALAPALASAIVVPDDISTIQAAINSGADTVLVREGFYPETITINHPLHLRGLRNPDSNEIPEMMGLFLDNTRQQSVEGAWMSDLHFRGPVQVAFHYQHPMGPFALSFSDCVMDSGVTDQLSPAWDQIDFYINRCTISGGVSLTMPEEINLGNNIIQGPVRLDTYLRLYVVGNTIEGPGSWGIFATFEDDITHIVRNTIRGFDVGIWLAGRSGTDVRDNLVESCSKAGIAIDDNNGHSHSVTGNIVRSCGSAIRMYDLETLVLAGNVAEDCVSGIFGVAGQTQLVRNRVSRCGSGITIVPIVSYYQGVESRGNVVEHCGGGLDLLSLAHCTVDRDTVIESAAGIRVEAPSTSAVIDSAFVLSCGGPGIVIAGAVSSVTRCIVGRCVSDGIDLSGESTVTLAGNTSFLNGGSGFVVRNQGSASGTAAANIGFGNVRYGLAVDPGVALGLSCNDWFGNPAGATVGVPAGATDLALNPIFCDLAANDVHLAPGSPLVSAPGCGLIGALSAGCPDGPTTGVIEAAAPAPLGFALARVGPVPTTGPLALELTLPRAAAIEVTVHDVQGRTVARLAGGEWTAGRHAIEWNGEGARGRLPPGLYMVRYRFPGGQDSRRVVISR